MIRRRAEGAVSAADAAVVISAAAVAGDVSADQVDVRVADTDDKEQKPQSEDVRQLQELYDLMREEGLDSVELEDENTKIRLQRVRAHSPEHGRHSSHHET